MSSQCVVVDYEAEQLGTHSNDLDLSVFSAVEGLDAQLGLLPFQSPSSYLLHNYATRNKGYRASQRW